MRIRIQSLRCFAVLAVAAALVPAGFGKMERWTDKSGNKFKAEPAEVIGPLALFKMADQTMKLLPLSQLSEADCIRFWEQVNTQTMAAADWSASDTFFGRELKERLQKVEGKELVPYDVKGRPEPRFYVLVFVNNSESDSWGVLGKIGGPIKEIKLRHPGLVEGVMVGLKHSTDEHRKMAVDMNIPFLATKYDRQSAMERVMSLVPESGYGVVVSNSNGVPILFSTANTDESARAVLAKLESIIGLLRPNNSDAWGDLLYYGKAVQPKVHANDTSDPVLVVDPLNAVALRNRGVETFEATLYVDENGAVTGVSKSADNVCPQDLSDRVVELLKKARFVPAVDHGKLVAGSYRYKLAD